MSHPPHPPRIDNSTLGEEYRLCSSSLCSFLRPAVNSSLFGPYILLSTLLSNALSLWSTLNTRGQDSRQYRTTGKIIFLYILIFKIFAQQRRRQKVLGWMVASVTRIQSAHNFLLNQFWFVTVIPTYLNWYSFKRSVCYIYVQILTSILVLRHRHIPSFLYTYF
jgi:hypothetical protein